MRPLSLLLGSCCLEGVCPLFSAPASFLTVDPCYVGPSKVVFNLRYIRITLGALKKKKTVLDPAFGDRFPVVWCVSWARQVLKLPR